MASRMTVLESSGLTFNYGEFAGIKIDKLSKASFGTAPDRPSVLIVAKWVLKYPPVDNRRVPSLARQL